MPSSVNVTRLYVIDDIMKIKLATEWHYVSPCSDLSTNKSLDLTIGYTGEVCLNSISNSSTLLEFSDLFLSKHLFPYSAYTCNIAALLKCTMYSTGSTQEDPSLFN